jgi:hypothetical protein
MPGSKLIHGVYNNKVCVEGIQAAYDAWIETRAHAPLSAVVYDFLPFGATMAKIPVDATAFAQRSPVSISIHSSGQSHA